MCGNLQIIDPFYWVANSQSIERKVQCSWQDSHNRCALQITVAERMRVYYVVLEIGFILYEL